jgi:hypothetical protein
MIFDAGIALYKYKNISKTMFTKSPSTKPANPLLIKKSQQIHYPLRHNPMESEQT